MRQLFFPLGLLLLMSCNSQINEVPEKEYDGMLLNFAITILVVDKDDNNLLNPIFEGNICDSDLLYANFRDSTYSYNGCFNVDSYEELYSINIAGTHYLRFGTFRGDILLDYEEIVFHWPDSTSDTVSIYNKTQKTIGPSGYYHVSGLERHLYLNGKEYQSETIKKVLDI